MLSPIDLMALHSHVQRHQDNASRQPCWGRADAATRGPVLLDGDRAADPAMFLEVTLVVLLGPVKRGRRGDLRDDLPLQRWLLGIARRDRGFMLASVMVEDR